MKYLVVPVSYNYHWYNDNTECFEDYNFASAKIFSSKDKAESFVQKDLRSSLKKGETLADFVSGEDFYEYNFNESEFKKIIEPHYKPIENYRGEMLSLSDLRAWEIGQISFEEYPQEVIEEIVQFLIKFNIMPYKIHKIEEVV